MGRTVSARDVLDTNAAAARVFRGKIVGRFRRTGPNTWDDYAFVHDEGETVDVLPGIKVQLERFGTDVRVRRHGVVVRLRWVPSSDEEERVEPMSSRQRRAYFADTYLSPFEERTGWGAAAIIADKLDD